MVCVMALSVLLESWTLIRNNSACSRLYSVQNVKIFTFKLRTSVCTWVLYTLPIPDIQRSHLTQTQDTQTQKSPSQNNALINETAPKSNPDTVMRHSPSNPPALHTPTYYHMQLRGARLIHSHILRTPDGVLRNCSVFRTVDRGQRGLRRVEQGSIPPVTIRVNPIFLDPAQAMSDNPRAHSLGPGLSPAEFREEISTHTHTHPQPRQIRSMEDGVTCVMGID